MDQVGEVVTSCRTVLLCGLSASQSETGQTQDPIDHFDNQHLNSGEAAHNFTVILWFSVEKVKVVADFAGVERESDIRPS